jgi:hypothetical protein
VCRFIDVILEFRIDVCHLYKLLFQTQFLSNYPTIIIICITIFLKFTINASSMKMNLVTICWNVTKLLKWSRHCVELNILPYLCLHTVGLVRMEVVWVCFDVLFFIWEFHFLFLLIFILFWLTCIYLCCWCLSEYDNLVLEQDILSKKKW